MLEADRDDEPGGYSMNEVRTGITEAQRPLRLSPGVVIVVLQFVTWFVVPLVLPDAMMVAVFGGLFGGLAVIVWWAFFSRAPRAERWGGAGLLIAALVLTPLVLHDSIATGMMGMMFPMYATPILSLAFVSWAVATRGISGRVRVWTMVGTILLTCGVWTLLRSDGIRGSSGADFAWRWADTPEELLLALREGDPMNHLPVPATSTVEADWPGFRGSNRDAILRGVQIESDWSATPPVEMWRRSIGPGWSSFAVQGDLLYTQEQRGEDEVVSCYRVTTGEPVWKHRDPVRFWEANAGAGPRATPTLSEGRVYTFGATGVMNVLNAADGSVVWSRNAAIDANRKIPGWGFSSSPLIVDESVIVAAAGTLVCYDLETGNPRWIGPKRGGGYSSPHLCTINGVAQILLMSGAGVGSLSPSDGKLLWEIPVKDDTSILQPALISGGDLLMSTGEGMGGTGLRRIGVSHGSRGWKTDERWTSNRLKPYFSDFVVHEGHAYGFDGSILACIDVDYGKRKWKGGRYGHGQLVLLADQELLLVLSERGELVLVSATPDQFREVALFQAIEGKTWNHPVLVGDILLVRNDQEMAAFRLSLLDG
jgi:outer membrane protein assembly factor BamB